MKLGMGEIVETAINKDTREEAIEYLKQNYHPMFGVMLKMGFDPNLRWALPEGNPPYKPSEFLDTQNMLFSEVRRMYLFHEGGHPNLSDKRRQQMFVEMLESLDSKDAKFVIAVRNKTLPDEYPGLEKDLIEEAYPGLLVY
jgi:hypothetical protein